MTQSDIYHETMMTAEELADIKESDDFKLLEL